MASVECIHRFVIGLVVLLTLLNVTMGFHIDISPTKYDVTSCGGVLVSCVLDGSDKCPDSAVMTLVLQKEEENTPLAFARQPSSFSYVDASKKYHVQGHLDHNYDGYLNVTYPNPENTDSGVYSCLMYCHHDNAGTAVKDQISRTLTVDIVDYYQQLESLTTQVTLLESGLRDEKDKVVDYNQKLESLTTQVTSLESGLRSENDKVSVLQGTLSGMKDKLHNQSIDNSQLEVKVTELEQKYEKQSQEISRIADTNTGTGTGTGTGTATPNIAFHATFTLGDVQLYEGHIVVFDLLRLNFGGGYNRSSGVFTAPTRGIYSFQLSLKTSCRSSCLSTAYLRANSNSQVVAGTFTRNEAMTSTSTVEYLQKGAEVKMEATNASIIQNNQFYSRFSGFLIKAI